MTFVAPSHSEAGAVAVSCVPSASPEEGERPGAAPCETIGPTVGVSSLFTLAEPAVFDAVSTTRMRNPTSAEVSV